jgi:hypothetical protein
VWTDESRSQLKWVKVHAMVGVKTNVVASAEVLEANTPDSPQFPGLVAKTAERFAVAEVSADKAYTSRKNFDCVESVGGTFYPAFKQGTNGSVGGSFQKAFHLFKLNQEEYERHYHLRSNVESAFSAIKRKFGESVRAKTDLAMRNETMAKLVCHNITTVIGAMYELGINPGIAEESSCTWNQEVAHVLPFRR